MIYEILDHDDVNLSVDIAEYIVGLLVSMAITTHSWVTAGMTLFATLAFGYHFNSALHSDVDTIVEKLFNK